ncbi:hypothetical protein PABG_02570 [Paracoccidioides brasiliensis Pb03]|nr:hypothetical protein PABG_02570 [Paracoccidioides brasiliensis Pb03]
MEFMAIEVLLNVDHTYRHDLESFFYVLLWQCSRRGWGSVGNPKGQPTPSLLTKWYSTPETTKRSPMLNERMSMPMALSAFSQRSFRLSSIASILFPIRDDAIFTGTPKDPEIVYGPIIKAFDMAIDGISAD